jgi:hypothetical protein
VVKEPNRIVLGSAAKAKLACAFYTKDEIKPCILKIQLPGTNFYKPIENLGGSAA